MAERLVEGDLVGIFLNPDSNHPKMSKVVKIINPNEVEVQYWGLGLCFQPLDTIKDPYQPVLPNLFPSAKSPSEPQS